MRTENENMIRMLVRTRQDFQGMRKRIMNRLGIKADGEAQVNLSQRFFNIEDIEILQMFANEAKRQEMECEKKLGKILKRFAIYNNFLQNVKGVGPIAAAWIVGWIDIEKATTVSKIWQYCGMNPGQVQGKKRKELKNGEFEIITTDEMIRGDKLTKGFISPYNKDLKTALLGVMADSFIRSQNKYCAEFYYPYKARLEQSDKVIIESGKEIMWSEATKGHRDRAARRYMVKYFLLDLYIAWRTLEGLSVREPYSNEYLGKVHNAA